ncbi:MAG: isoprenyl transferase [Candidatus Delongbacteria bacterium]|nr:isoprenyl transferase [Candidatus Delongbacteria bacterium]MBN2836241.1 isoprenyl transferase [Candidatus Delongbacteria bacterium]
MEKEYQELKMELKKREIPTHIAIIMDGNGRWAKKQGNLRTFGHVHGVDSVREILDAATEIDLKYLTLYTFSKENWNRPEFEVKALMSLLVETINKETVTLMNKNVKVKAIGRIEDLTDNARNTILNLEKITENNNGLHLNIAISYSGREEIIHAVKTIIDNNIIDINEDVFSSFLYTAGMPDPDLLIRTGGELRVSNFLLWQIAYSEIYVTEVLWPDFSKIDFLKAIEYYQSRERRFGKTSEQINNN